MPIKYVPFIPEPVEGQAVLGNFNRILRYKGADEVSMTLQRGMPLYEMERQETVGENADGNMVIRGECVSTCAYLKEQGVNVNVATKVSEGHPNILDDIKAGRISMVINTTNHGRDAERDGFKIRRSTVEHAIPCLTSMDTARELQRVMSAMRRRRIVSVVALQDLSLSWED